jgi:NAD(P)-dependent dehydrogenase (short-subunit alcohol dehydrogenase family)
VVLVTGAAGGIGAACVHRLPPPATPSLVDRDAAGLASLLPIPTDVGAAPPTVTVVEADLASVEGCRRAVAAAVEAHGRLDVLVNAAGVWVEGPADLTTEDDWDRCVDVNLKGLYFVTACHPPPRGDGRGGGQHLQRRLAECAAPASASKGGVSLTRALALVLALRRARQLRASTPRCWQAETYGGDDPAGYLAALLASYPQGEGRARFIRPEEVAALVHFLAGPEAGAITGANVAIDLGLSAGI